MSRCLKAKGDRVADVEIPDALPPSLNDFGLGNDVADGVGESVDALSYRNRLGTPRGHGPS
jgi:hypothetical protein